jgi:hypothetical protein
MKGKFICTLMGVCLLALVCTTSSFGEMQSSSYRAPEMSACIDPDGNNIDEAMPDPISDNTKQSVVNPKQSVVNPMTISAPTKTILMDYSHGVLFNDYPMNYTNLITFLGPKGYEVVTTNKGIVNLNLSDYDIVVLSTVWSATSYSTEEIDALQNFVDNGGGLLLVGEAMGCANCGNANNNLSKIATKLAGITMGYSTIDPIDLYFTNFQPHEIFDSVNQLYYRFAGGLLVSPPGIELAHTDSGSNVTVAGYRKIIALGDSSILGLHNEYWGRAGDKLFIENLFRFLSETLSTNMSADKDCRSKDIFGTGTTGLEDVYVAGTLPVPAGKYTFYLTVNKDQWLNGSDICSAGCVDSKLIDIDSSGHFCDLLWTPPIGDNNTYDIILDVNGNGYFDAGIDFLDSNLMVGIRTLIELSSFTATAQSGKIVLEWETASELDNAGFTLWRSEAKDGKYIRINSEIVEAEGGATEKAAYTYSDDTAKPGITCYYKLEDIDTRGGSTFHGPVSATIPKSKTTVNHYSPYWIDIYSKSVWPYIYGINYSWPYYPYP